MKASELRNIIREEISKVLRESANKPTTIAEFLKIQKFPFHIKFGGKVIYTEPRSGSGKKYVFDENTTIAKILGVKARPFKIKNEKGGVIYSESGGEFPVWSRSEFDTKGNMVFQIQSDGFWSKHEYDSKDREIYREFSSGEWIKREYDPRYNSLVYYETSDDGVMKDTREWNKKVKYKKRH